MYETYLPHAQKHDMPYIGAIKQRKGLRTFIAPVQEQRCSCQKVNHYANLQLLEIDYYFTALYNILLNEHMQAKVYDFGLAKCMPQPPGVSGFKEGGVLSVHVYIMDAKHLKNFGATHTYGHVSTRIYKYNYIV